MSELDLIVSNEKLRLHAEALASLGATCRENSAAALGRHAGAETVALSALTGIGLIGAFHIRIPFIAKK